MSEAVVPKVVAPRVGGARACGVLRCCGGAEGGGVVMGAVVDLFGWRVSGVRVCGEVPKWVVFAQFGALPWLLDNGHYVK